MTAAFLSDNRPLLPRLGTVNCSSDEPGQNVAHLAVAHLGGDEYLAICGATIDKGTHDTPHARCGCAPADQWDRCPACIEAQARVAAKRAALAAVYEPHVEVIHPAEWEARARHAEDCPGRVDSALADRCVCGGGPDDPSAAG